MVVFGQLVRRFVVEAVVHRHQRLPVAPQAGQQVDALHDGAVLARPVARDRAHVLGVRIVQGRGVEHQHAPGWGHQAPRFLPQGGRVGFEPVQQARIGVVGHQRPGVDAGGFRAAHRSRAGNQKVNVLLGRNLRLIHAQS